MGDSHGAGDDKSRDDEHLLELPPGEFSEEVDDVAVTSEPTGEVVFPSKQRDDVLNAPVTVAGLTSELDDARARILRSAADFDNFRKRVQRERRETVLYANETILRDILPVLDNLERAILANDGGHGESTLLEGVRMVVQQFQALLDQYGVRRVPGHGTEFEPAWHEAMQQRPTSEMAPGYILEELQPGYMFHDRLLRPALVIVSMEEEASGAPQRETQDTDSPAEMSTDAAAISPDSAVPDPVLLDIDGHYIDLGLDLGLDDEDSEDFEEDTLPSAPGTGPDFDD